MRVLNNQSTEFKVPAHVEKFNLKAGDRIFELEYDDPYIRPSERAVDYKAIGLKKEHDVGIRCEEYNWDTLRRTYNEDEYDYILAKHNDPRITIPVQVKSATYVFKDDSFQSWVACNKNGNSKSQYNPNRVKFIIIWTPLVFKEFLGRRRGVYIIPTEEILKVKQSVGLYPHRKTRKSMVKIENLNNYFEAWHLLDEYVAKTFRDIH